jgi:quercetin dioxygenase-like cupin family protein
MIVVHPSEQLGTSGKQGSQFTGLAVPHLTLSQDGVTINTVAFTPGARTHWHRHERGQILQILAGRGLVGLRDGTVHVVRAGDTVWTTPGEEHWHGAARDAYLTHVAISLGVTEWAEAVDEHFYATTPTGAGG